MTGEPVSTTLLVASAASTGLGLVSSRQQEKLDLATLNAETERAKLVASEQAASQAVGFRNSLASQLALSSLRAGAGGSLVRQFGAESFSNFLADQRAIGSKQRFIDASADLGRAQARSNRFSRDVSSVSSLLSTGIDAVNLNDVKAAAKATGG